MPVFHVLIFVVLIMVSSIVLIMNFFIICDTMVLVVGRVVAVFAAIGCLEALVLRLIRLSSHLIMMLPVSKILIRVVRLRVTSHPLFRNLLMMVRFWLISWMFNLLVKVQCNWSDLHVSVNFTVN